jgi:hypothetical protein
MLSVVEEEIFTRRPENNNVEPLALCHEVDWLLGCTYLSCSFERKSVLRWKLSF